MHLSLLSAAATSAPSPSSGPGWTDIGGFWVSVGGFVLAIALAIVGWIQAYKARGEAGIAREQADTAKTQAADAKRIADEAQAQTAAAQRSATAAEAQATAAREDADEAQKQTRAAVEALELEKEPQLAVRVERHGAGSFENYMQWAAWEVVNHGRAWAQEVYVRFNFDPDQSTYGLPLLGDVQPGQRVRIKPRGGKTLPQPDSIQVTTSDGKTEGPVVELEYRLANGEARRVKVKPIVTD